MGGIFQKIKERIRKNALIKSVLLGSIVGLATAAVLLFVSAFVPAVSPWLGLLGLATGALTFISVYLLCSKNDKRLAKSLDTKLGLHERVQTMLEFQEAEGDMYTLQREDTAEKLSAVPAEKFKIRKIWRYLVALALAAILAIGSVVTVVIRGNAEDETPSENVEIPYEMDDWQQVALKELIRKVRESALLDYVKDPLVDELETLLAALPDIKMQSVMKANVKTTIKNVDSIVEGVNSYKPIYYALIESEHPVTLAFADLLSKLNASTFGRGLDEKVKNAKDDEDVAYFVDIKDKAVLQTNLGNFGASLSAGLDTLTELKGDGLYDATSAFADALNDLASRNDNYGLGYITEGVDNAFAVATEDIGKAIYEQEINEKWRKDIIQRLQEIFGLKDSELPKLSEGIIKEGGGNGSDEPPDNNSGGGGAGDGGILAGSNSLVYDPNTNEQVHYLTILGDYYALVIAQINDGTISEELADCLIKYFGALYNGAPTEGQQ